MLCGVFKMRISLDFPRRTTASEFFNVLNDYFLHYKFDWGKCMGICTDNVASMTGHRSGV